MRLRPCDSPAAQGYQGGFSDCKPTSRNHRSDSANHFPDHAASALQRPPIPEEFFHVTKNHFAIIKCVHHLTCLRADTPTSLLKTAKVLRQQLRPAFISDDFKVKAESIALAWVSEATTLLREHYEDVLQSVSAKLCAQALPEDLLDSSLELATKWAKNQLHHKLRDEILDEALSRIIHLQSTIPRCQTTSSSDLLRARNEDARIASMPQVGSTSASPATASVYTQTDLSSDSLPPPHTTVPESEPSIGTTDPPTDNSLHSAKPTAPSVDLDDDSTPDTRAPQGPLSQLDLFGSIVEDGTQSERQLSQPLPESNAWSPRVVLGDDNLNEFSHPDTTVVSRPKGRLSHFHRLFSKYPHGPQLNVNTFIICISTLDKRNALTTNISSLKSLLGTAKKVFPRAKVFIQACGIDNNFSIEEQMTCSSLNNFVRNRTPSSSVHIPTAEPFSCTNDVWDVSTRTNIYNILKNYLN